MAAPRTWVTSELVTASIMNAHVRDMFVALAASKSPAFSFGDPGGAVLTTGVKFIVPIRFGIRVSGWTLCSDQTGSIVLDLWRATYPTVPTVANTITGTEKPTIAASRVGQDLTLSSWTTDIPAGSLLAFNIDSCTSIKQGTLTLDGNLLDLL